MNQVEDRFMRSRLTYIRPDILPDNIKNYQGATAKGGDLSGYHCLRPAPDVFTLTLNS